MNTHHIMNDIIKRFGNTEYSKQSVNDEILESIWLTTNDLGVDAVMALAVVSQKALDNGLDLQKIKSLIAGCEPERFTEVTNAIYRSTLRAKGLKVIK